MPRAEHDWPWDSIRVTVDVHRPGGPALRDRIAECLEVSGRPWPYYEVRPMDALSVAAIEHADVVLIDREETVTLSCRQSGECWNWRKPIDAALLVEWIVGQTGVTP